MRDRKEAITRVWIKRSKRGATKDQLIAWLKHFIKDDESQDFNSFIKDEIRHITSN